ncbi:dienelactone hydrolase endo-1,3,1,4-beta-D-glucanase [Calocera viscosa TUFC12733]|uniref:Dienelactone hydrolase endo-1,3,1,4-beta-D-glucanase n=1 Tax=Calocera viscosa (strain TUFC12733) TaxID=1330018 RepID=A0A167LUH0_CALVF|nr:dienelactone hydrolase endo-1,3,1,4-beta-D-glucanase [Calocera viscosa TUFC12733]
MKLCPDCVSGVILPGTPKGSMIEIGPFEAYLASPPTESRAHVADKHAVVLFTDVFGLALGNPKIIADAFASELGLDVYVPDMFNGKPPLSNNDIMPYDHQDPGSPVPWWKFLGFLYHMVQVAPGMWWGPNSQTTVYARMRVFVETLKTEKKLDKVGAVGYCYGGSVIASLIPYHLLSSAVIAHPGDFDHKLVDQVDFPTSWVTCEEDFVFGPKIAEDVQARFAARSMRAKAAGEPEPEYEFKRYMGTRHGFGCRPALEVPQVKEAFERASDQTTAWFRKTLLEIERGRI